jgi:hypothetical protein
VEEAVVRPALEAPGHAKAAGQHLAQAETATSPVDKAVHLLEATKETTQSFTGFATPFAAVSGRPGSVGSVSDEALSSRAVRAGENVADGLTPIRPPGGLAGAAEEGAARQTMMTGKEWYDYFSSQYGAGNVEWVSGSGRTIQWPAQLPKPAATEMLRVRPPTRSGTFVPDLAAAAGPRPPGAVAHHVQPLFMGGLDSGTQNAAWAAEAAHQAGHASLHPVVVPLPLGTWIVMKP